MVHRRNSVVTRLLPVETSFITFEEDIVESSRNSAAHGRDDDRHIETCTPIIASEETLQSLHAAATHIRSNLEPVAFPTETVYGLGALASSTSAVERIFQLKGRPSDNPLIVHISSLKMLREQVLPTLFKSASSTEGESDRQGEGEGNVEFVMPRTYQQLMRAFWPGPLTLLFSAGELAEGRIPRIVTAGHPIIAVRIPAHPVARALIALSDAPIAAPSANSSGRPSPTKAEHVFKDMSGKVAIILNDGGSSEVGLESTVVDGRAEDGHLRVLRPGGVTVEDLRRVLDEGGMQDVRVLAHRSDYKDEEQESMPTTPGMKYRHYAPTVPVVLLVHFNPDTEPSTNTSTFNAANAPSAMAGSHPVEDIPAFLESLISRFPPERNITLGLLLNADSRFLASLQEAASSIKHRRVSTQVHVLGTKDTPHVAAQRLFDGLLTLEHDGVDIILVESVDEKREGLAIMNRMRKAAGETRWITL